MTWRISPCASAPVSSAEHVVKRTQYKPPVRYSEAELSENKLVDLRRDLEFSERTDPNTPAWNAYRAELRTKILALETIRRAWAMPGKDT